MKVLLSAYACEPNKGSEPGVGWNWAVEIARLKHEVWVLTRANNRASIEAELGKGTPLTNLNFLYYDLPGWLRWWKKGGRGIHLYYLLWQWGAYRIARKAHAENRFDRVHHITFGSIRHPSFMGRLGVPFIFGPVGGGERSPWQLRQGVSIRSRAAEIIRDLSNWLIRFDPLMLETFSRAEAILVKTPHSQTVIPRRFWKKVRCELDIGVRETQDAPSPRITPNAKNEFRVLYLGRFLYWKGMHLGFPAFAQLQKRHPGARLTVVGAGPAEKHWRRLVSQLLLGEYIRWRPWLPRADLPTLFADHDVLLFPSLHDSSGNVLLEAMSFGLPIVCLDLGGPSVIVDKSCAISIDCDGLRRHQVIQAVANALSELADNEDLYRRLVQGSIRRASQCSWGETVGQVYSAA